MSLRNAGRQWAASSAERARACHEFGRRLKAQRGILAGERTRWTGSEWVPWVSAMWLRSEWVPYQMGVPR